MLSCIRDRDISTRKKVLMKLFFDSIVLWNEMDGMQMEWNLILHKNEQLSSISHDLHDQFRDQIYYVLFLILEWNWTPAAAS